MKVIIMAGGKGSRIAGVNDEVPKPMIEILGKPILQWQIECLRNQGYVDIILSIGHLGHVIRDYFGDGAEFGVHIAYIEEGQPLGTAGALFYLKDILFEDFLLLNGDVIFDIDIDRFAEYHRQKKGLATLFTHPNDHPYDSGVIGADGDGRVTNWLHKEDPRQWYKNRVNAGLHMLSPRVLNLFTQANKKVDLDRDILKPLASEGQVYVYDSPEYVKDMGTPERLLTVEADLRGGRVVARNLREKQKAVFLDRDGTINEYVGFLRDIDDFRLRSGIAGLIRSINQSGYLVIVVTNQPVIARGELTWDELEKIHNKMETLLGMESAFVDDIFICPHHPDKGFPGEWAEYKIACSCRKPEPGLLLAAAEKYNIDLQKSYMVGDSISDMEAGRKAGCHTLRIESVQDNNFLSE